METFANDTKYIMSKIGMPLEELTYQVVNIYFNCLTSCLGPKKQGFWPKINCTAMSNFAMGTILGKPFPKIVLMAKLHSLLACAFIMST